MLGKILKKLDIGDLKRLKPYFVHQLSNIDIVLVAVNFTCTNFKSFIVSTSEPCKLSSRFRRIMSCLVGKTSQWGPCVYEHIDGLVQCCSISSALAMKILQSCTKPSVSIRPNNWLQWRHNERYYKGGFGTKPLYEPSLTDTAIFIQENGLENVVNKLVAILSWAQWVHAKKMDVKMSSGNWRPFCLGLNELLPCW